MNVYYIEVSGIPKESLLPALRWMDPYSEPDKYTLNLSITGRLTSKPTKRANLDSYKLAEELLEYWEPRLRTRGWGNISVTVQSEVGNKWLERKVPEHSELARQYLGDHADTKVRVRSKEKGNLIIAVRGYQAALGLQSDNLYLSKFTKEGSWIVSTNISSARRYTDRRRC